jgi:hypothetical protein
MIGLRRTLGPRSSYSQKLRRPQVQLQVHSPRPPTGPPPAYLVRPPPGIEPQLLEQEPQPPEAEPQVQQQVHSPRPPTGPPPAHLIGPPPGLERPPPLPPPADDPPPLTEKRRRQYEGDKRKPEGHWNWQDSASACRSRRMARRAADRATDLDLFAAGHGLGQSPHERF